MPEKKKITALCEDLRGDAVELEPILGPVFVVEDVVGSPGEIRARRVNAYRLAAKRETSKSSKSSTRDTGEQNR
jgi:hypothetical protein